MKFQEFLAEHEDIVYPGSWISYFRKELHTFVTNPSLIDNKETEMDILAKRAGYSYETKLYTFEFTRDGVAIEFYSTYPWKKGYSQEIIPYRTHPPSLWWGGG